jgi:hypothetical protein
LFLREIAPRLAQCAYLVANDDVSHRRSIA